MGVGTYSRWGLIRGWALIRINTVCHMRGRWDFRFFGFGVRCRFRVCSFLTSGFRFLAKNTSGFSVSGNFLSGLSVFH